MKKKAIKREVVDGKKKVNVSCRYLLSAKILTLKLLSGGANRRHDIRNMPQHGREEH